MDVLEAIENAEADLATTRRELQEAKELVAALEQDQKRISHEIVGLRSFANRLNLFVAEDPAFADGSVIPINGDMQTRRQDGPDLTLLSRSDAVVAIMASHPEPLDRTTIAERLADADRDEGLDDVSLALSGLKRSGRVVKLGRGLWQLSDEELLATADGS